MKKYILLTLLSLTLLGATKPALATDLLDVYQQALQYDPTYLAAQSSSASKSEILPQNRASLLPNLSATANSAANSVTAPPGVLPGRFNTEGYSVTLTQPLINFNGWMAVRSASDTVKQAHEDLIAAAQNLIFRVAKAYFLVLNDQDNLTNIEAQKKSYQQQLYVAKEMVTVGSEAVTAFYQARASFDGILAQELAAKNKMTSDLEALRQLTGESYFSVEPLKIDPPLLSPTPADPQRWVAAAKQQNPTLLSTRFAVEAARANIKANFSNHLPTLNAIGDYTHASGPNTVVSETRIATVGLQLTVPIYQGGLINSQTRQAQDDFQTASANMQAAYYNTIVTTQQQYNTILSAIDQIHADQQAVSSAKASLDNTEESFKVGKSNMNDVLIQQQSYYQATLSYSEDKNNYILDTLQLKQAAGILTANDLRQINNWLHTKQG